MKELPKVYVNKIDKEIRNSLSSTYVNDNIVNLDDILTKDKYSFNHKYQIELKNNNTIKDSIIQIQNDKLLTIKNGWIKVSDIKNIFEIKKVD